MFVRDENNFFFPSPQPQKPSADIIISPTRQCSTQSLVYTFIGGPCWTAGPLAGEPAHSTLCTWYCEGGLVVGTVAAAVGGCGAAARETGS